MIKDISLHILDIAQNSLTAKADLIEISIEIDSKAAALCVKIHDNGIGMTADMVDELVKKPYEKKGLSLFKQSAEKTGGSFYISSLEGIGTRIKCIYNLSHREMKPIGNLADTLYALIIANPEVNFIFILKTDEKSFCLDTMEFHRILEDIPINSHKVAEFIREYVYENIRVIDIGEF